MANLSQSSEAKLCERRLAFKVEHSFLATRSVLTRVSRFGTVRLRLFAGCGASRMDFGTLFSAGVSQASSAKDERCRAEPVANDDPSFVL